MVVGTDLCVLLVINDFTSCFNKSHLSTDCHVLQDGLTALHLVAQGGHYECIKLLLESNCNVNALTNVRPVQSVTNTVH